MPLTAGIRESGARFAKGKKFFHDNTFPPYNESQSEANQIATRWAFKTNVQSGDKRLVSYHGSWYIIEKFDSLPFKYQIIEKISVEEYNKVKQLIEVQNGRRFKETLEDLYSKTDNNNWETAENGRVRSGVGGTAVKHSPKSKGFFRMGENKNSESPDTFNPRRSDARGFDDRQGREYDSVNDSKDDTIYLSAVERGDIKPRTSHTSASAGRFFYNYNDTDICNIMLPDYRYILPLRSRS